MDDTESIAHKGRLPGEEVVTCSECGDSFDPFKPMDLKEIEEGEIEDGNFTCATCNTWGVGEDEGENPDDARDWEFDKKMLEECRG